MNPTTKLRELLAYREMVRNLVRRDLVERYQRSVFGVLLALAMPVLVTVVFSLVFSGLIPSRTGLDYALQVFIAYIAWDYCSRVLNISADTLRGHSGLIGKVRFPLEVLPLTVCLSVLVQLACGVALFVLANGVFGSGFHATLLWLPILLGLEFLFVLGLAYMAAMLGVLLQDFGHLLAIFMTVWFYGSAVFYSPEIVPSETVRNAMEWNPLFQLITALRDTSLDGVAPDMAGLGFFAVSAAGMLIVGQWLIHRARFTLTEVLG